MSEQTKASMEEALRLTRAGKVSEATAMLTSLFGGGPGQAAPSAGPRTIEGVAETVADDHAAGTATVFDQLGRLKERFGHGMPDLGTFGRHRTASAMPLPDGARFLAMNCTTPAGSRAYKLYVPSSYADRPMPLVVMLHGCTQSADDFAAGTRMNHLAEEHGFLVVYPEQSATANGQRCWNWFNPGDQKRGAGEPHLITEIVRQVMADYRVDPDRVYAAGLSAGGAAAAVLAAAYPDLFAAVGVHSGLACGVASDVGSAFAAMRGDRQVSAPSKVAKAEVPIIVFHGDSDHTVHARNGEQVIEQAKPGGTGRWTTPSEAGQVPGGHRYVRTRYVDEDGVTRHEHWVVHGAGHAWQGGSPQGSYTDPQGPDASREMVRFFLEHPRMRAGR